MVTYRYTAQDSDGRHVTGHLDAATVDDARRQLEERGLVVLEVMETGPVTYEAAPSERLSAEEAREFVSGVAEMSAGGSLLEPGLRAIAEESESPRLAAAFSYLADQLEQGRPLDEVLESTKSFLPGYLGGLIHAAARTGQLGPALTELVEHYRVTSLLRSNIRRGFAYPLLVACLAAVVLGFVVGVLGGSFEEIYSEFNVELPVVTRAFFWWRHAAVWMLPLGAGLIVIVLLAARQRLGAAGWQRWLATAPLVGPLWHWLGLLEWIGLLQVMVRHQITLLEALRLAADGVSNRNVGRMSASLAEGIARGRSLSQAIAAQRQLPTSLIPLVRWGERGGGLADSLQLGGQLLEDRVRTRSFWLQTALPPLLLIAIGCVVLFVIAAFFGPLFSFIHALSG